MPKDFCLSATEGSLLRLISETRNPDVVRNWILTADWSDENIRNISQRASDAFAQADPKDAMVLLRSCSEAQREVFAFSIIGRLIEVDVAEAMNYVASLPDGSLKHDLAVVGIRSLAAVDPNEAYRQSLALGDTKTTVDALRRVVPVWLSSTSQMSYSSARNEVAKIENTEVRKKAESMIWEAEREQLRKEVTGKPSEAVQAIVDGSSNFDSYWLEEAVHTWVSKDFDSANEWYERNWNSLPKEKAQYVAAGFATQAIGQGDVDTARQWAAMIQDTKTKERIEALIVKAEAEPR